MRWHVEWLSSDTSDVFWRVGLGLRNEWEAGVNPADPPLALDEFRALRGRASSNSRAATVVGFIDGEGVAIAECNLMLGVNSHLAVVRTLWVAEPHRRQGVGSEMLRAVATFGRGLGYSRLSVWASAGGGALFCKRNSLTHEATERHSRLTISDVDFIEQAVWAKGVVATAGGYRLVRLPSHCPAVLLEAVCASYNAEQDLPLGDLDYTHQLLGYEGLRSAEADLRTAGLASFRAMALTAEGAGAGITELCVNTHRPQLGIQGTTAVVPGHRGHRIGRWLKAANLIDTRAGYPELCNVDTTNAEANPWMLDINIGMGFGHHHTSMLYGCAIGHLIG